MNIKRILSVLLALLLLSTCAFAEVAEETVEHDYEVITDPVIITYGDREIHVSDAMSRFMSYYQTLAGYESYGIDASGFLTQIKETVLAEMTQELIEEVKISELGYDKFTEEEQAEVDAQVEETYNEVYLYYYDYFTYNSAAGTDIAAAVNECLEYYNYTKEDIQKLITTRYAANKMALDLTKDVVITEEDMQEYYTSLVTEDQEEYNGDFTAYEEARTYGSDDMICWSPDGYRRVLQVLIGFEDEDTKTEYNKLLSQYRTLIAGEALELEEGEIAPTLDELKTAMAEMEEPLRKVADEVTQKFNDGATIEELMSTYSADTNTPAEGYYVHIQSGMYDSSFVDAAFSVKEIGELSAPYAGQHGLYMVYYLADVPGGAVPLEEIRASLEPTLLNLLQREAYFNQLTVWMSEMNIETDISMFVTGYES